MKFFIWNVSICNIYKRWNWRSHSAIMIQSAEFGDNLGNVDVVLWYKPHPVTSSRRGKFTEHFSKDRKTCSKWGSDGDKEFSIINSTINGRKMFVVRIIFSGVRINSWCWGKKNSNTNHRIVCSLTLIWDWSYKFVRFMVWWFSKDPFTLRNIPEFVLFCYWISHSFGSWSVMKPP